MRIFHGTEKMTPTFLVVNGCRSIPFTPVWFGNTDVFSWPDVKLETVLHAHPPPFPFMLLPWGAWISQVMDIQVRRMTALWHRLDKNHADMEEARSHKCRKATAQTCIRNSSPVTAGSEETARSVYRKSFSRHSPRHNRWNRAISAHVKTTVNDCRTGYSELRFADVSWGVDAWASPQSLSPQ